MQSDRRHAWGYTKRGARRWLVSPACSRWCWCWQASGPAHVARRTPRSTNATARKTAGIYLALHAWTTFVCASEPTKSSVMERADWSRSARRMVEEARAELAMLMRAVARRPPIARSPAIRTAERRRAKAVCAASRFAPLASSRRPRCAGTAGTVGATGPGTSSKLTMEATRTTTGRSARPMCARTGSRRSSCSRTASHVPRPAPGFVMKARASFASMTW
jgi:hypothetical protein